MNILHLVAGDLTGGAARGAYWLHKGLISQRVTSTLLISGRSSEIDSNVICLSDSKLGRLKTLIRSQFDPLILKFYKKHSGNIFSTGYMGFDFTKTQHYKDADIIHLHWVNAGLINIKHLKNVEKPIIWTLRDMWPLTGGCHYSLDCENYKTSCGMCPQLGSHKKNDLSHFVQKRKLKYLPNSLTAVGISNWLTNEAKKSSVFKYHNCFTIFNNIDVDSFRAISKDTARQVLGVKTDKKIVLCGSTNLKDFYKGFRKYLDALEHLDKTKIFLAFFGNMESSLTSLIGELGFEFKSFGYLNDNISLNLVYSAADVFIAPSIQEAFGKTLAEAQCSGTPVVCFDATGPKDLVDHKETGYKAEPFNPKKLARGINWVLNAPNYSSLCQNARDKVLREFDSRVVAKKYIELYQQVISG